MLVIKNYVFQIVMAAVIVVTGGLLINVNAFAVSHDGGGQLHATNIQSECMTQSDSFSSEGVAHHC